MAKYWLAIATALFFLVPSTAAVSELSTNPFHSAVVPGSSRADLRFSPPSTVFDGKYEHVWTEGSTSFLHSEGQPQLPLSSVTFLYPVNTRVLSVKLLDKQTGGIFIRGPVYPSLPPPIISSDAFRLHQMPEPVPDPTIYSHDAYYPVDWVSTLATTGQNDKGETTMFFTVYVYPVRYNPERGALLYLSEATLVVNYASPSPQPAAGRGEKVSYDTLVLAPNEFNATLQSYLTHKQSMGHVVKFVTLEQVYGATFFPVSGRDNQEKIKYFLKSAKENWSINYVILVGDVEKLPWRSCYVNDGADGTTTPSDYYYADFYKWGTTNFCSWDSNSNSVFGESGNSGANIDGCDLNPDVTIGRIPAGSTAELQTLINKIKGYEKAVPDQPWMGNVTFGATDTFDSRYGEPSGIAEGEYTLDQSANYLTGFTISKYYETKGTLSTANLKNSIDKGCLFAAFSDHGNYDGVLYPAAGGGTYGSGTATSQVNGLKLPVALQDACLTTAFDSNDCLAENMVLNPNGGMITSAGASRIAFGAWGNGYPYVNSGFIDVHFFKAYSDGKGTPGKMLDAAKSNYLTSVGIGNYADFKTVIEYTLIGDPTILVGGPNLNVTMPSNVSSVDPGSFASYNITLENFGKTKDTVDITVATSAANWSAQVGNGQLTINPNASIVIPLIVSCPPGALAGSFTNTDVRVSSVNTGLSWDVSARTSANRLYRVGLNVTEATKLSDPNRTVSWTLELTNKGNGPDVLTITANGFPQGCTPEFSRDSLPLEAFETGCLTLSLHIPASMRTGMYGFSTMSASTGEPVRNATTPLYVRVNQVYGAQAALTPASVSGAAGSEIGTVLKVTNLGNGLDTIDLKVQDKPGDWTVALTKTEVRPDAFASENITVSVRSPSTALAGKYTVTLNCTSVNDRRFPAACTLNIDILALYSYKMNVDDTSRFIKVGGEDTVEFDFSSDANAPDTFELTVESPDGWKAGFPSSKASAAPFGECSANLSVKVPANALAGTYSVKVTSKSLGDEKLTASETIKFTVEPYYGLRTELKNSLELMPGEEKTLKLTITNDGNAEDSFLISLREPDGILCSLATDRVTIPARSSTDVDIIVKAPEEAPSGEGTLKVKVTSTGSPTCLTQPAVLVTVRQVFGLGAAAATTSATLFPEETVTFTCTVTNKGNGEDTLSLSLEGTGAGWARLSTTSVKLSSGASSAVTVTALPPKGTEKGAYSVRVAARSQDTSVAPASVEYTVNVDKKPVIDLGKGGGQTMLYGIGILAAIIVAAAVAAAASRARKKKAPLQQGDRDFGRVSDVPVSGGASASASPWSESAPAAGAVGDQAYSPYQFQAEKWVSTTTQAEPAYEPLTSSPGYGASEAQASAQMYAPVESAPYYQVQDEAPPARSPAPEPAPSVAPAPPPVAPPPVAPPAPTMAPALQPAPAAPRPVAPAPPPPAAPATSAPSVPQNDSIADILKRLDSLTSGK